MPVFNQGFTTSRPSLWIGRRRHAAAVVCGGDGYAVLSAVERLVQSLRHGLVIFLAEFCDRRLFQPTQVCNEQGGHAGGLSHRPEMRESGMS